ncbi:MAG TPA: DUF1330 domain-containing protein [Stellaceae bacterium]|nr:DUF1330 domain-containing protein [Stellaceae bacterium]
MRDAAKVALALVAGIGIGAWGIPALRAQTGPHPAYVVTETKVTDPAGFTEYMRGEPATLAPYHGRALARALPDTREGAPPEGMVSILGFDSLQDANRWYNSPEYSKLTELRRKSAASRIYLLDGVVK